MRFAYLRRFFAACFLFFATTLLLTACGGGAGGSTTTTPAGDTLRIQLSLADGSPGNRIVVGTAANVRLTLYREGNAAKPIANARVTFAFNAELARLGLPSGQTLTDATGTATTTLTGLAQGVDTLVATAEYTDAGGAAQSVNVSLLYEVVPTTTPPSSGSLTLALAGGSQLLSGTQGSVTAQLLDASGRPVSNTIVNFENDSSFATFSPESGTVLTNAEGIASLGLIATAKLGADQLKAVAELPGGGVVPTTVNAVLNYQVVSNGSPGTTPPLLSLAATDSAGQGDNVVAPGDMLTLTAVLLDNGLPVANQKIRFILQSSSPLASLNSGTATTNAQGRAQVQLSALSGGFLAGAFSVSASTVYRGQTLSLDLPLSYLPPVPGIGSIAVAAQPLSYRGSTTVTIQVIDTSRVNRPALAQSVVVKLTSICQGKGLADFDDANPTTDLQGVAVVTYRDLGCGHNDVLSAIPDITSAVGASQTIQLSPVPQSSPGVPAAVQFVDATPTSLQIRGSGGSETAVVRFRVVDANAQPVANQTLNFTLQEQLASIASLNTASAVTDGQGLAGAAVAAGTVGGPVAVVATLAGNTALSAQSSQLLVSTRIPHQNGFSLSVDIGNPEFHDYDGVVVNATLTASDRYGNPVPDGMVVSFKTEGGIGVVRDALNTTSPVGSCVIRNSSCTVTLTSAGNRSLLDQSPAGLHGRMTLIAFARGEDSFADNNGDGRFSDGDTFPPAGSYRYGEPYIDGNESGVRDIDEEFLDFDGDGVYNDGQEGGLFTYHGLSCSHATLCSARNTRYTFDRSVVVWSGSAANIVVRNAGVAVANGGTIILPAPTLVSGTCVEGAPRALTLRVADLNDQSMPAATTVALALDAGNLDFDGYTVPNTNSAALGAPTISFNVIGAFTTIVDASGNATGCQTTPGTIGVTVTTPKGNVSIWNAVVR
ncbi:hypothetical protein FNU76_14300 [Chitinimonas arctica]|uniref:Big-1 domain-containing protein n=1 Tax=Chitinimonas arctica TaxID=2594795 RepID=A0A516SH00_9NEIS|nr:hypothetical protein [Chitinimonas arctica]QDQ27433.1 hypothetical protein FNU76_14300 [Chitinimonas arctica]